ncbi:MAG: hypothetical protein NTW06_03960 [Candidatus Falkowbacteria bacterium]|nr:hypothetical protein [Candidatus Falkowbacteria bacterium]
MLTKEKKARQNKLLEGLLEIIHKYFLVVVLVIFAAIIVVGYLFLIQPKYTAVSEKIKTEDEQRTKELEDLTVYADRLRQYQSKYNGISAADKEKIDTLIAGKYLPENIFIDMEKLIFSRGLILNSIDVSSQGKPNDAEASASGGQNVGGIGEATIKLDITGVNYEGLKQLLAVIESSLRLLDVKKINFSPEGNTAQLEIATYYLN